MDVKKIQATLAWLKQGGLAIIADNEDREAEGDLVGFGASVTPGAVNFMTKHARGLLCTCITPTIAKRLALPQMTADNTDPFGTAFTLSVDHKSTTTGISAYDRCRTIKALANPTSQPDDFYKPGHCFPLVAKDGGVLERNGHTEAAVTLAKLAGVEPVAYICEILQQDGHMARRPELKSIAAEYHLPFLTIKEIQEYVQNPVSQPSQFVNFPTEYGHFQLRDFGDGNLIIKKGDLSGDEPVLLRLHSKCQTGDALGSLRCDCGPQLHTAMQKIDAAGRGVILYLNQEGRGIGLTSKIKAYALQDQGHDTYEANTLLGFEPDERHYDVAAEMLKSLGIHKVKLLTNNPDKLEQLTEAGIEITDRIPLEIPATKYNQKYLHTKREKFHHLLKNA